VLSVWLR